jgi:poly-gamma-glutamate synthesis protein (capsule biosynthesis protein)
MPAPGLLTLFLCGDVMLGRGVDQILAHPGDPELREEYVHDARRYVALAEAVNGPIARPVDPGRPWGEALAVLDEAAPDLRVVNLETSITTSPDFAPGKAVHYRMHPANLPALRAVRPDACVLANNHVLDFGRRGLLETLDVLSAAGLRPVGAGRDAAEAWRPAVLPAGGSRVVLLSVGSPSSGIPRDWAATEDAPGVALLPHLSLDGAERVLAAVSAQARPGDLAVVSIHWGSNWGQAVHRDQRRFAHRLIDGGVHVVHGHSSHHPRAVEVYRGRLVLYGCGDLVDDYEGISGAEEYRPDLRLLYLATVEAGTGRLVELRMTPLQAFRMSLRRASAADSEWLRASLDSAGAGLSPPVRLTGGDLLVRVSA